MDWKSKSSRRLPSSLTARFENKTQPTETQRLGGKRTLNGVSANDERLKAGTIDRRETTQRQTPVPVSNANENHMLNVSDPLKTYRRNFDPATGEKNATVNPAPEPGFEFQTMAVNESTLPSEADTQNDAQHEFYSTTWNEADNASSKTEVGLIPESEGESQNEGCSDAWKDIGTENFSSTWTDPDPFIPKEDALFTTAVFPGDTENMDSLPACIVPGVIPSSLVEIEVHSSADNDRDPNLASTEDSTESTWLAVTTGTSFMEAELSSDSLITIEEPSDTFSSTWTENVVDTEAELPVDPEDDTASSNMETEDEQLDEAEGTAGQTEGISEGDIGLGSFESAMEKVEEGMEEGHSIGHVDYNEIADFDVDDMNDEASDEELPSLQDIYQRCQTIRRKRFYADLYNAWQEKVQEEAKEDAMKILTYCGFCPADPDEVGEEIDAGLRLVPDRFWQQESKANEISVEDLKVIVEEKKDAENRKQFEEYCVSAERVHHGATRRRAIVVGGGTSSLLHNYLRMNLLNNHVPMYYFPSYLSRYQSFMERHDEEQSDESDSS